MKNSSHYFYFNLSFPIVCIRGILFLTQRTKLRFVFKNQKIDEFRCIGKASGLGLSGGFPFIGGHNISTGIAHIVGRVLPLCEGIVCVNVFSDAVAHGVVVKTEVFLRAGVGATDFSYFAFILLLEILRCYLISDFPFCWSVFGYIAGYC